jgi:hypothetical protein
MEDVVKITDLDGVKSSLEFTFATRDENDVCALG